MSETCAAWAGLLEVLAEAGERFAGEEWMVVHDQDVAEGDLEPLGTEVASFAEIGT